MTQRRRALLLLTLASTTALALPTRSSAGTYKVYGCRLPSGAPAPTYGWVPSTVGSWLIADNKCGVGGGLMVALDPNVEHHSADAADWFFHAATNTRIVAIAGERAAKVGAGQAYGSPGVALNTDNGFLDRCIRFYGCSEQGSSRAWNADGNTFVFNGLDTATIAFFASCGGGGTCPAEDPSATGTLFRSEITLADNLDPRPSEVSGPLVQAGTHEGDQSVTLSAVDEGSGVYRAFIDVDGKRWVDQVVSDNDGLCSDAVPGDGDPAEFLSPVPCKLSANAVLQLDTTQIPNGDHSLRVGVVDAAGNTSVAYGPAPFRVDNAAAVGSEPDPGPINGDNGSSSARLVARFRQTHRRQLIVAYGRRIGIFGRLVNEQDRGIGNAEVQVLVQRANGERTGRATYKLRTRHDGTFRAVLRATVPSQVLAVAYRAHERVAKPTAEASLRLKVKAGLTLRARPGAVHNGQTISFWGRLLGGPIPREGRLLEVQVKHPWGWQTFATVRVRRHGTFRYRRRLRRSFEPITYVFRVRCRAENGYPYETGVSNAVAVRVV